jgi:tetratricopeptide (TPR) repeat protein
VFRFFRVRQGRSRIAKAWRVGNWPVVIEASERLLKDTPNDHELLNNLGVALLEVGETTRAESSLRRANELHENAIHWNNLGRVLLAAKRYNEASAVFQRAIEFDPSDPKPRFNQTICLRSQGSVEEANAELQRFLEAFPDHAGGNNDMGNIFDERGDRENAVIYFARSIELEPHYLPARLNLIRVLCNLGRYPESTPHLEYLAKHGVNVLVNATDEVVEIILNGEPFYRGAVQTSKIKRFG